MEPVYRSSSGIIFNNPDPELDDTRLDNLSFDWLAPTSDEAHNGSIALVNRTSKVFHPFQLSIAD
jgi:hypothetical protein